MELLVIGILSLFIFIIGSIVWSSLRNGITPTPTSSKVKHHFIAALPKILKGPILELGAGWGTLAFPLARRYPHNLVIAYESSLMPYLFCKLRHLCNPLPNLTFKRKNFFDENFQEAALVVCYLYPGAMRKLKEKFKQELKKGTLIATHTFAIPGDVPVFTDVVDDLYRTRIYHYIAKFYSE